MAADRWDAPHIDTAELIKDKDKKARLDQALEEFRDKPGQLVRVLQKAQEIFDYIPEGVQVYVADRMSIPISEVAGVVSFYSTFSTRPKGKYTIGVCLGTTCYVKGAQDIVKALKKELSIDVTETTKDGLFSLTSSRCVGACGMAPVMAINDEIYSRVKAEDVPFILAKYRNRAAEEENLNGKS
ncbi:NAD(P)H-dependent oxidoreductase subunit E [Heliobacillus mobilis]|uniref:NAD(P)H-dependent oxidoreductase subunit E n=2 Tax=Heliobacterium mobile TaxID=28064 RepID=A0A6I3SHV6_HELMO|nr:NAD(P)H-dependent oxidoreductase subunit E [Heliobacterium mobile]